MSLDQKLRLPPPFDDAVRDHERGIMRFLIRMTGDRDDALDLFQETWLRAYRAYPQLKSADGLRPWLYRIAGNLCRNRARDNFRRARVIAPIGTDSDSRSASSPAASERDGWDAVIQVRKAVAGLPHQQRSALMMRKFGGLDYREIGQVLQCSAESARASVYQALKKLKSAW
jgi:RNA polymerase sigma-70 factor, ECF subfamily